MDVADLKELSRRMASEGVLRCIDSSGKAEELPMEAALRAAGKLEEADDWAGQTLRAQQLADLASMPVIGVMGQLNVGKSSVVASFLGDKGKALVPRGDGSAAGTHRFVYWLPESWGRGERWETIERLLASVHGKKLERLDATNPEAARKQYQAGLGDPETMQVPLLGFDPSLDKLGCAFLDCPDVQTRDNPHDNTHPRLAMVKAAARICSIFLVVWGRKQVRERLLDEFLKMLRGQCPGVPVHLLLNYLEGKAEPLCTFHEPIVQDILKTYKIGAENGGSFYGAFNFGHRDTESLEPPTFKKWRGQGWEFPGFFQVDASLEPYEPDKIAQDRFLLELPKQLDSGELQKQQLADSLQKLPEDQSRYLQDLQTWANEQNQDSKECWLDLYCFCRELFTDDQQNGKLALNEDFLETWRQSFLENAPPELKWPGWFCKPINFLGTKLRRHGAKFFNQIRDGIHSGLEAILPRPMKKAADFFGEDQKVADAFKGGSLKEIVAKARLLRCFAGPIADGKSEKLEEAGKATIQDFLDWATTQTVDRSEIDSTTRQFWQNADEAEKKKAGIGIWVQFLLSMVSYAALLLVVVDGGATVLAVTSISHAIPGVALAGSAAIGAGAGLLVGYFNQLSNHQFLKFFSLATARFGLPAQIPENLLQETGRSANILFAKENKASPRKEPVLNIGPEYYWETMEKGTTDVGV